MERRTLGYRRSTGPDGKEEGMDEAHVIARLPFGAYILQEEGVPFEQGYVQAPYQGLILEENCRYWMREEMLYALQIKPPVWPMSGMIMEGSLHIGQMKREKKSRCVRSAWEKTEERLLFIRTSRAQMMKTDFRYIIKTESRYGKKNAGLQEKAQARMEGRRDG